MPRCTHSRYERGSALIEGALSLTVFLMIIFGIMEFGRAVFAYNFVSSAARTASRYAMVRGSSSGHPATTSDISNFVSNQAIGLDRSAVTVTTTWTPDNSPGSTVKVAVKYSFQPIAPFIPTGTWNLQTSSQIIVAQ